MNAVSASGRWATVGRRTAFLCIFILLVTGITTGLHAQKSKSQLQKEKQQNINKIKETEKILNETGQQKNNSLGELSALNQRIKQQESLIGSIKGEVNLLDSDIDENNQIIQTLEEDLGKLKEEYASMLFSAQKASGKSDKLTFLFSARSFDQLVMRLKYMEQYGKSRQEQAEAINRTEKILKEQVRQTEVIKDQKKSLLHEEVDERTHLSTLKQKQRSVVRSLEKAKKSVAQLDNLINDIIKEEMERAARETAAAKAANAIAKVETLTTLS